MKKKASVAEIVGETRAFYTQHCPRMLDRVAPATTRRLVALEKRVGHPLPTDLREFLTGLDFRFQFEFNFGSLDCTNIGGSWKRMTTHLRKGTYAGWVEAREIEANNPGIRERVIQKCWWNEGWLPFAEDSCGNLKCVDLSPGPRGVVGQIVAMEIQDGQGPSATGAKSLRDYLAEQLGFLRTGKFRVDDEGLLEIDRYG